MAYTLLSGSIFAPVFVDFYWERAIALGTLTSMFVSAVVAAWALLLGRLGANLYLLPPLRGLPPASVQ